MYSLQYLLMTALSSISVTQTRAQEDRDLQEPRTCGGRLKGPVGVIQTPNFPNSFPVPIKCRWIIEHEIVNGTISVYFTQQYTTSGLTFTEYMYYDDTYKLGERRALTVTDENVTKVKWLQVQSPVLVVDLTLDQLEGTQLRALGLLSVFGFNMTYMVKGSTDVPGPSSCSAIECRLLGHCYAQHDYKEFFCSCFDGYSGADCGTGPLCPRTSNMCQNGGTCRQMGPAAVSCICAAGYTGDMCESQIHTPECGIECSDGCAEGRVCDCSSKETDFSSVRFEVSLQIVDETNTNISEEIIKYMTSHLKLSNITLRDDIEVLNVSRSYSNSRTVWLRIWGERSEAGLLRATLARLTGTRGRTDRLRLLPATLQLDMQPALGLHALIVNQRSDVWEGSEFILSCIAYGSPEIAFTWYKDGIKINFNGTTRDIWTRSVSEDALGRRMAVLGVSEAERLDGGRWSCAAEDAGRRRCRALGLTILRPPDIRLVPPTLTVNKGDNVSITCLAGAGRVHGVLGFSWARERNLLALAPGRHVWEDLYPAGSVLKLYNVQKSSEFRCQVSSMAGTNSKGVTMWVVGEKDEACRSEASHSLRWLKTAPGVHASAPCPPGYTGDTTRFCEPKTTHSHVKWRLPNFSGCVADSLRDIYEQFTSISYGYSWDDVSDVAHRYAAILRSLPPHPGEGAVPLQHARNMLHYLQSPAGRTVDRKRSVGHLLTIYDTLLKHPDAFLDEEKIYDLQNAIVDTAAMQDQADNHYLGFIVKTLQVFEDKVVYFNFIPENISEEWLLTSVGVELVGKTRNASVVAVQYHDLTSRLPSMRRSMELKDGQVREFRLASAHVQLAVRGAVDAAEAHTVTLLFVHSENFTTTTSSKLTCGLRSAAEPHAWNTKSCEVRITEPMRAACRCRGLGTYSLFTVATSILTEGEENLKGALKVSVGLSGSMCLAAAALQLLSVIPTKKTRLPILLKAATAGTHSAAMLTLLECDTRKEDSCTGSLGWVIAACWCAGCAALCAQPLLLQAELAGRVHSTAQSGPSVGLLAGVCTLVCLTARLCGDSPLKLGAAAQAVCAAGCALLTVLCVSLTLCAALRLRRHKVPAERCIYFKERGRLVSQTLVLVLTTSGVQAAGVAYAQPGARRLAHVAGLSAAALVNGVAMLVCYVLRDKECLHSVKRMLLLSSLRDWHDPPAGDTSLSLYIKQDGEVESRRGASGLQTNSSPVSPLTSYWRAPGLESPVHLRRKQSIADDRADIVRCVEYNQTQLRPHRYNTCNITGHTVCDLIQCPPPSQTDYMATVCLELGVNHTLLRDTATPYLTCSVDLETFDKHFDTCIESCKICQSNPDMSRIVSPSIKSCLKQTATKDCTSNISLPTKELKEEIKMKSNLERVNKEKNKTEETPESEKVLNKITNDLDFLLNRTKQIKCVDQIVEAST